jgi:2'-5' RNA ligase
MVRLFIAFEVPEHISSELRKIQQEIKQEGVKLVKEFHLTFKFLGEVKEEDIDKIKTGLENISFQAIDASLDGVGVFPSMHRINTVWIGIEPEDKIGELAKIIDPEEKRFKAHITLGRVKFMKNKDEFVEKINKISVQKLSFKIDKLKLIKSTLTKQGPVYETIFEKPL